MQNKKPWNCTNVLKDVCLWANVLKDVCSIQKTLFFLRKIKHFPSRNNVGDFEGGVFWRRPKQPTSFFTPLYPPKCKNLCFSLGKVRLLKESQIFNLTRNVINLMSAQATPPNLSNFKSRLMQIVKNQRKIEVFSLPWLRFWLRIKRVGRIGRTGRAFFF